MAGDHVDEYIATFEHLAYRAGLKLNDLSTLCTRASPEASRTVHPNQKSQNICRMDMRSTITAKE